MQQIQLLVSVICLIGFSGLQLSAVSAEGVAREVIAALREFSTDESDATGLEFGDYEKINEEFQDAATSEQLEEEMDESEFQLVEDFILTPWKRWHPAKEDDEATKRAYVTRMEQAYKRFWPIYIDRETINSQLMYKGKFMITFIKAMLNMSDDKPTLDMWRKAKEEYHMVMNRILETLHEEDIYEHLDDLEYDMNYHMADGYRHFIENYGDMMDECKSDADLEPIIAMCREDYNNSQWIE